MFDRGSRPTITESVVEPADSAVESADYWSRRREIGLVGMGLMYDMNTIKLTVVSFLSN